MTEPQFSKLQLDAIRVIVEMEVRDQINNRVVLHDEEPLEKEISLIKRIIKKLRGE